jgi:hypothetical protein
MTEKVEIPTVPLHPEDRAEILQRCFGYSRVLTDRAQQRMGVDPEQNYREAQMLMDRAWAVSTFVGQKLVNNK